MGRKKKPRSPALSWRALIIVIAVVLVAGGLLVNESLQAQQPVPQQAPIRPQITPVDEETRARIIEQLNQYVPSIVRITTNQQGNRAMGSGFIVGTVEKNGVQYYVVATAAHVVEGTIAKAEMFKADSQACASIAGDDVKVGATNPNIDIAYVLVPVSAVGTRPPLIPFWRSDDKLPLGAEVFSRACDDGANPRDPFTLFDPAGNKMYEMRVFFTGKLDNKFEITFYKINPGGELTISLDPQTGGGSSGGPIFSYNSQTGRIEIIALVSTESSMGGHQFQCATLGDLRALLPPDMETTSAEQQHLDDLMKELEEAIRSKNAPVAPELMPMPMP